MMKRGLLKLVELLESIQRIGLWISSFMVGMSVLLVTAETLNRPANLIRVSFAEEMTGYALGFITLVAGSEAIRRGEFIRLYIFVKGLREKIQLIGLCISYMIGLVMLVIYLAECLVMVKESWAYGAVSNTLFKTPLWLPQGFVAIGLLMMVLQVILKIVRSMRLSLKWDDIKEEAEKKLWSTEGAGNIDFLVK